MSRTQRAAVMIYFSSVKVNWSAFRHFCGVISDPQMATILAPLLCPPASVWSNLPTIYMRVYIFIYIYIYSIEGGSLHRASSWPNLSLQLITVTLLIA